MQLLGLSLLAFLAAPQDTFAQTYADRPDSTPVAWAASVSWADVDRDGLPDLYIAGLDAPDRLLTNAGEGSFQDTSVSAGLPADLVSRAALLQDADGDGRVEILAVGADGALRLFRGLGDGLFEELTQSAGLAVERPVARARWFDIDRDGRLDLHAEDELGQPLLFHQHGALTFGAVTLELEPKPGGGALGAPGGTTRDGGGPAGGTVGTGGSTGTGGGASAFGGRASLTPPPSGSSANGRGGPSVSPASVDGLELLPAFAICAGGVDDLSNPGNCLPASSIPMLGALYPLSSDLFIDASGYVGLGTTTPLAKLNVAGGDVRIDARDLLLYDAGGLRAVHLDAVDGGFGSQLFLYNAMGGLTVELDADFASSGDGFLSLYNDAIVNTLFLDGGMNDDGAEILMENDASVTTVILDGEDNFDSYGGRVELFNDAGVSTWEADSDVLGTGDSYVIGKNASGIGTVYLDGGYADDGGDIYLTDPGGSINIFLDGNQSGAGGAIWMENDVGAETIDIDSDVAGDGYIYVRNQNGDSRILLDGGASDDGGDVGVYATDGSATLFFDGNDSNDAGVVSVRNDISEETVKLVGDDANDSGQVTIWDRNGANTIASIVLNARDSFGTGSEFQMLGQGGNVTFDVDASGQSSNLGVYLASLEDDGSLEMQYFDNILTLYDESGSATITYNGKTGSKSAVVEIASQGRSELYVMESPEVWFEDFGSGRLQAGIARVDLDPLFRETVTIDAGHPMKVFVSLTGESSGVWIEKGTDNFIVHELANGRGDATFDWRVVAKRRGHENKRLEPFVDPAVAVGVDPQVPHVSPRAQDGSDTLVEEAAEKPEQPVTGVRKTRRIPVETVGVPAENTRAAVEKP